MKLDNPIYQYLSIGAETLRILTGIRLEGQYKFSAPVIKGMERRIDALFIPKNHTKPVYVVEFQAQPKPNAWYNLLAKVALYGEKHPTQKIHGVLIFLHSSLDNPTSKWLIEAAPGLLSASYLDKFLPSLLNKNLNDPFLAVLAPLIIETDEQLQQQAPKLWNAVHNSELPTDTRLALEQILETWFIERFKNCNEQEVLDMLQSLTPLEETRAYKSIFAKGMLKGKAEGKVEGKVEGKFEGKLEGKLEGKIGLLKRIIKRRFGKLPKWVVTKISKADLAQLDSWAESIFDANKLEDLINR
jgi:predicted transposase YdaD